MEREHSEEEERSGENKMKRKKQRENSYRGVEG